MHPTDPPHTVTPPPPPPFRTAQASRRINTGGPFSPHRPATLPGSSAGGAATAIGRTLTESKSCIHLDRSPQHGLGSMAAATTTTSFLSSTSVVVGQHVPDCERVSLCCLPRVASAPSVMSFGATLGCGRQAVVQQAVLTSSKYPVALVRGRDALSDDVKALLGDLVHRVRCSNLVDVYHIVSLPLAAGGVGALSRAPHSPSDQTTGHDAVVVQLCDCTLQDLFYDDATRHAMTRRGFGDAIKGLVGDSPDRPLPCDVLNNDGVRLDAPPQGLVLPTKPDVDTSLVSEVFLSFLALDVLNGLSALHAQCIAHGDLKASNVFLTNDGTFAIGDFLMAQRFEAQRGVAHGTGHNATEGKAPMGMEDGGNECLYCGRNRPLGARVADPLEHARPSSPVNGSLPHCAWCAGSMPLAQYSDVRSFALLIAQAALLGRLPAANLLLAPDGSVTGSSCWISWHCLSSHFPRGHYSTSFCDFLEAAFCVTCTSTAALLQHAFLVPAKHRQKAQRVQLIRAAFSTRARHIRHRDAGHTEQAHGAVHGSATGTPVSSPTSREKGSHVVGTPTSAHIGTPTSTDSWATTSFSGSHQALQRHTPRSHIHAGRHPHAAEKSRGIIHQPQSGRK